MTDENAKASLLAAFEKDRLGSGGQHSDMLRTALDDYVDGRKAEDALPEQIIIEVRAVAVAAGWRPSYGGSGLVTSDQSRVLTDFVLICVQRYFGV